VVGKSGDQPGEAERGGELMMQRLRRSADASAIISSRWSVGRKLGSRIAPGVQKLQGKKLQIPLQARDGDGSRVRACSDDGMVDLLHAPERSRSSSAEEQHEAEPDPGENTERHDLSMRGIALGVNVSRAAIHKLTASPRTLLAGRSWRDLTPAETEMLPVDDKSPTRESGATRLSRRVPIRPIARNGGVFVGISISREAHGVRICLIREICG
jgi:hypothetical protein